MHVLESSNPVSFIIVFPIQCDRCLRIKYETGKSSPPSVIRSTRFFPNFVQYLLCLPMIVRVGGGNESEIRPIKTFVTTHHRRTSGKRLLQVHTYINCVRHTSLYYPIGFFFITFSLLYKKSRVIMAGLTYQ